jgi:hypothetical protein
MQKQLKQNRQDASQQASGKGSQQRQRVHGGFCRDLEIQQIIGNHGVLGWRGLSIQAKLRVNNPNDEYEKEADRAAEAVMRMSQTTTPVKPEPEPPFPASHREGPLIQRWVTGRRDGHIPWSDETSGGNAELEEIRSGIDSIRGDGQPLSPSVRRYFEPRFKKDFGEVRIHADPGAGSLARRINAKAFATGNDVVFGSGQYAPETTEGRRLLAHELAHVVQQQVLNQTGPVLQRKDDPDIENMDWSKAVEEAEEAAKKAKTKKKAKEYYKRLVVRASEKVTAPAPLKDKKPSVDDIIWSSSSTVDYAATADPKKVDNYPDDYWKWLTFNPSAVQREEAFTASIVLHELDHAAHAKALYDEWKKAEKGKEKWDDFYISHYTKWTEEEMALQEVGLVSALAGLPKKISPSVIEFRAYANQFVNFFHKVSVDKQGYLGKAVVLFYPLKTTTVEAKIGDPALDLPKARQQILDYFLSPPAKDKAQKDIIKILVSAEIRSALLFRPSDDHDQIKKDFKDIFDFNVTAEERKVARRNYKPE